MQVKDGIVQASKHLLCSPWAPGLFGDFAFNHDKRNKFLGFFKVLVYFQDVGTEKKFYAQCRRGGKDQTICILNCGQDMVLVSSLSTKRKLDNLTI